MSSLRAGDVGIIPVGTCRTFRAPGTIYKISRWRKWLGWRCILVCYNYDEVTSMFRSQVYVHPSEFRVK